MIMSFLRKCDGAGYFFTRRTMTSTGAANTQIARELFLVRSMPAVRTMNPTLGRIELQHDVAELAAQLVVFDLARDAHTRGLA